MIHSLSDYAVVFPPYLFVQVRRFHSLSARTDLR